MHKSISSWVSVAGLAIALAAVGCAGGSSSSSASGDEQDLTLNRAVAAAMEADVHQHAANHVVTKLQDALDALVTDKSLQGPVKDAIDKNTPDGAASPFFGNITVSGTKYIWADFDTDEGSGPTPAGQTFVFDATGKKILFRSWSGSHDFT